tara:strand:- start:1054 stop:1722 length:669 start_codon:yes stop_codon:yes gene_type:complete
MNLSSRLFEIIDDVPVYNAILINIKCFKELYLLDKTEDKHKYANHLLYIWYTCDPNSPYFNSENKIQEAAIEIYGRKKVITKQLRKCMEEYKKRQSTPMIRAYERAMTISDQNESIVNETKEELLEQERLINDCFDLMKSLGKNPEDIVTRIELMERMDGLKSSKLKYQSELSKLIPTIKTQVQMLLELKKDVDKDRLRVDSDENAEGIGNYIVDNLIDKYS